MVKWVGLRGETYIFFYIHCPTDIIALLAPKASFSLRQNPSATPFKLAIDNTSKIRSDDKCQNFNHEWPEHLHPPQVRCKRISRIFLIIFQINSWYSLIRDIRDYKIELHEVLLIIQAGIRLALLVIEC